MAYILCIETSGNNCSIALGNDGNLIAIKETDTANSHASLSGIFIDDVLNQAGIKANQLTAIAVSEGPGSYTGLRIGVSLAKAMCYALNIPLIAVSTLQAMAYEATLAVNNKDALFAPMIDARRMEVYTAIYHANNQIVSPVSPMVLDSSTHHEWLEKHVIYYSGNGSTKWKEINNHPNAGFLNIFANSAKNLLPLAQLFYNEMKFVNISYFEPQYLKLFNNLI